MTSLIEFSSLYAGMTTDTGAEGMNSSQSEKTRAYFLNNALRRANRLDSAFDFENVASSCSHRPKTVRW
jgi:hypothetical protein